MSDVIVFVVESSMCSVPGCERCSATSVVRNCGLNVSHSGLYSLYMPLVGPRKAGEGEGIQMSRGGWSD